MALTANLKVTLHANDTVVAESSDSELWQKILVAINKPSGSQGADLSSTDTLGDSIGLGGSTPKSPVDKLAGELNVSTDILVGACSPTDTEPFIHLDKHHFEAFKKNIPTRGPNAVGNVVLAATLLVLWKSSAELGSVSSSELPAVLGTINVNAKNPTRSINNCEWLQIRNGSIVLNPAKTSMAVSIAQAYCSQSKLEARA